MIRFRKILLALSILVLCLLFAWWWNRPEQADMAEYVPADALVYFETNSLPEIARALVSTEAWRTTAPAAGIDIDFKRYSWLTRAAAETGIGSAETVVLSRAQVAVVVMGIDAAREAESLKVKPRVAVVFETHTGQNRVQKAVEKLVGDFATRAYVTPSISRRQDNATVWTTWTSPDRARQIVAAVDDTVAIIGNNEAAVASCLAVRRGERPSLATNQNLRPARERAGADALAFGYIPQSSMARVLQIAATVYIGRLAADPKFQSAAAVLLPQLSNKLLGEATWSARLANGSIEDRYQLTLRGDIAGRLREPLRATETKQIAAGEYLPENIYQLTTYNFRQPDQAWRSFNQTIAAQLDVLSAPFVMRFLDEALKTYGVESPRDFLPAIGDEMVTARLDDSGDRTVTFFSLRDAKLAREQIIKHLGANPRTERTGEYEMLIANKPKGNGEADADESVAACFVGDKLLLTGAERDIRACLSARTSAQTLNSRRAFARALDQTNPDVITTALTFTDERAASYDFINGLKSRLSPKSQTGDQAKLTRALDELPLTASQTRLVEDGFEKRTRSAFGQFGALAAQFLLD